MQTVTANDDKVFDPNSDTDIPTAVRIAAVDYYVAKEPIFTQKLNPEKVKVRKRDGTIEEFSRDVLEIARIIKKRDKDALKMGKAEILAIAREHLKIAEQPATTKHHTSSITPNGAAIAALAIHSLLQIAAKVEGQRKGGDSAIVDKLNRLISDLGFKGSPDTPPLVPYTLVLSASQISQIVPDFMKFKAQFDEITNTFQTAIKT
jgi:hypothetical protein